MTPDWTPSDCRSQAVDLQASEYVSKSESRSSETLDLYVDPQTVEPLKIMLFRVSCRQGVIFESLTSIYKEDENSYAKSNEA